jgi:hypothetical protein
MELNRKEHSTERAHGEQPCVDQLFFNNIFASSMMQFFLKSFFNYHSFMSNLNKKEKDQVENNLYDNEIIHHHHS